MVEVTIFSRIPELGWPSPSFSPANKARVCETIHRTHYLDKEEKAVNVRAIKAIEPPYQFEDYMYEIAPLAKEDGGGFLISLPDLPGCMSDGETIEETVANGRDAFVAWISAAADEGKPIPKPTARPAGMVEASGKFVARLPKTLHARLVVRAKQEGVSLNSLVLAFIAEGLGHRA